MCIMEIHADSTNDDMVQAMAHNLSTVDRDADMLLKIFRGRHRDDLAAQIAYGQHQVHLIYALWLGLYGELVAEAAQDPDGHYHRHHGEERTIEAEIKASTEEARTDEER